LILEKLGDADSDVSDSINIASKNIFKCFTFIFCHSYLPFLRNSTFGCRFSHHATANYILKGKYCQIKGSSDYDRICAEASCYRFVNSFFGMRTFAKFKNYYSSSVLPSLCSDPFISFYSFL